MDQMLRKRELIGKPESVNWGAMSEFSLVMKTIGDRSDVWKQKSMENHISVSVC